MVGRSILVALCVALAVSHVSSLRTQNGRINILMGTSAGCTNVVPFIRNHLVPTFNEFRQFLNVNFVPWGRTQRAANGALTCQFGVNDCWANRLHRCVLNHLRNNVAARVRYMQCEFTSPFPAFRSRSFTCATQAGMAQSTASTCVNNPQRDTLDQQAQQAAAAPMRTINWVPFVVFNNNINVNAHNEAHRRLRAMVCQALLNDPQVPIRRC